MLHFFMIILKQRIVRSGSCMLDVVLVGPMRLVSKGLLFDLDISIRNKANHNPVPNQTDSYVSLW